MDGDSAAITRRDVLRGAAGAAGVAGASGTAAAAEGGGGGGGGSATVEVGPNGNLTFVPGTNKPLYVKPGTTVKFVWKSNGHNVVPTEQPSGANWKGVPELHNSGHEYKYTFEKKGKYHYICEPHEAMGMVGDIEVTDNPPKNEGHSSILPDSAKTLGVATVGAMSSVLGLAYVFMKYGGDYGGTEEQ